MVRLCAACRATSYHCFFYMLFIRPVLLQVFDLSSSNVVFHSEGEHKRKDGLFKTGPRGVLDLQILSSGDHMLSCGSDGAVKLRKLTNCATPITQYLL